MPPVGGLAIFFANIFINIITKPTADIAAKLLPAPLHQLAFPTRPHSWIMDQERGKIEGQRREGKVKG